MKIYLILIAIVLTSIQTQAGVILNETRIIYSEGIKEKTITATNKSKHPYIIQVWVEEDSQSSSPNLSGTESSPFFVTPGMAKIPAESGQALRIIKKNFELPSDRESLYIFNLLQIPPSAEEPSNQNTLQLLIKKQLKLFYRPKNIKTKTQDLPSLLKFTTIKTDGKYKIKVENSTAHYATITSAKVKIKEQEVELKTNMIAPFSEEIWETKDNTSLPPEASEIEAILLNDFGGTTVIKKEL